MEVSLGFTSSSSLYRPISAPRFYPRCLPSVRISMSNNLRPPSLDSSFRHFSTDNWTFDVVVVGAGIIGLSIARRFLTNTELSVAVVDAKFPCAGATGAGQGYIWMTHRIPGSETWDLYKRSNEIWKELVDDIKCQGMDPLHELGWKQTGSLLIGRTSDELDALMGKVELFSEAGLTAAYLSANALSVKEPSLEVGKNWGAAFLRDDFQMDARLAVAFIQKGNRSFRLCGRYQEFYHDPVISLVRSNNTGDIVALRTAKNMLHCKRAVVVATGAWSGSFIGDLLRGSEIQLIMPVMPRKGYLLSLENFQKVHLNHGLMEFGYVDHLKVSQASGSSFPGVTEEHRENLSISMTATTDAMGFLLLGSSRQFAGFDDQVDESIIDQILNRAQEFFPALRDLSLHSNTTSSRSIRIGFRPYMHDGKPIIGRVPGLPKMIVATGHEGGGLSMATGTAEMVVDMLLGNSPKIDPTPYSVEGR